MIQEGKSRLQMKGKRRRRYVLQIERENGEIEKLTLDEELICWEGFRNVGGRLMRGALRGVQKSVLSSFPSEDWDSMVVFMVYNRPERR